MSAPDRVGVVVGYRHWRLSPKLGWPEWEGNLPVPGLYPSGVGGEAWSLTRRTVAECSVSYRSNEPPYIYGPKIEHDTERAPHWGCTCGLHGYYSPNTPISRQWRKHRPNVVGAALYWGDVIYHEDRSFFRAEYAYPIAFLTPKWGSKPELWVGDEEYAEQLLPGLESLELVASCFDARIFETADELMVYAEAEAERWCK